MKRPFFYYATAFIAGMAVMAVELTASRILAPYFGNSLFVWTNVIGLVMLALAVGYFLGGLLSDKYPDEGLYFSLVFVTGLWVICLPFVSTPLFEILTQGFSSLSATVVWGSFVATAILLVLPMMILGMVVPFTVKLVTHRLKKVGTYSGRVSMVSTAGSLVGTFLPAFVLIPTLGTMASFLFMGLLLMFLGALGTRKLGFAVLALAATGLFFVLPPVYANAALIYEEDSPYGYIFVTEEKDGERRLHIDTPLGVQSTYHPETPINRLYYSYFGLLPGLMDWPESVLILGHAGGSFTRIFNTYYPWIEVTGVELDPAVTEVARDAMALDELDVDVIHADARTFLYQTEETYDLILVDAYHGANLPAHLATVEFFELATSHLNPDGLLALNAAGLESEFSEVLKNTMAQGFGSLFDLSIPGSFNHLLVTGTDDWELKDYPEDLEGHATIFSANGEEYFYDSQKEVFIDNKATRVTLLNESMWLDLLSQY